MKNLKHNILRWISIALILSLLCTAAWAQQDAMYTQFFSNQLILNPAYAGSRDAVSATGIYRNQWTGFPGAPVTQTASLHAPIMKGASGLGLSLMHDHIGITDNSAVSGAYAYRLDLGKSRLAFGLAGEMRLQQINWSKAHPNDPIDPSISFTNRSLFLPNLGAGAYLSGERYFVGFSIPRLLETELKYASTGQTAGHLAQLRRHFYLSGGLALRLTDQLVFKPQVLVKYVAHAPLEVDLNLGVVVHDKLWIGSTLRSRDSFDFFLQYAFQNKVRVGYAYDYAVTPLSNYSNGSHEIMLGIDLGKSRNGFFHPRYF